LLKEKDNIGKMISFIRARLTIKLRLEQDLRIHLFAPCVVRMLSRWCKPAIPESTF